jgi:hypothetical protein
VVGRYTEHHRQCGRKKGTMIEAVIIEQGNGFPIKGDYVSLYWELYQVESVGWTIQTGAPWGRYGNWLYAEISEADWRDLEDEEEPFCCDIRLMNHDY